MSSYKAYSPAKLCSIMINYDSGKNRGIIEDSGFKILLDEIDNNGGEKHQIIIAEQL